MTELCKPNPQLPLTSCSWARVPGQAAVLVQVNGLVNGYTATNLTLPLTAVGSGRYQGQLNLGIMFPDLTYATNASIAFCNANTANIQASCKSQGGALRPASRAARRFQGPAAACHAG